MGLKNLWFWYPGRSWDQSTKDTSRVGTPHRKLLKGRLYTLTSFVKQKGKPRQRSDTHMHPRNLLRSLLGFSHSIMLVNVKGLNSET